MSGAGRQAALPLLMSPDISNNNEFTAPWLDYEPYLNGETDVYFYWRNRSKESRLEYQVISGNAWIP